MKFSIIVVCLNPGEKLNLTLNSILNQTCKDFEIVVKDGGSTDGSLDNMVCDTRIRLFSEKDSGIYEAMNQAVTHATGEYILFLNCGDAFFDENVLSRAADYINAISAEQEPAGSKSPMVFYGDTYSGKNGTLIASPPAINGFACYRNIPCHQSCFYDASLCRKKPYDSKYAVRADYDHFLWCYYVAGAKMHHMGFTVSSYEGGGFSENKKNRERDKREHGEITSAYMSGTELLKYKLIMALTLAPLRNIIAESKYFSGLYHRLKDRVYNGKKRFILGCIFFLFEMLLLVFPGGFVREDCASFLDGTGMWTEDTESAYEYKQFFSPKYSKIKSIGVYLGIDGLPDKDDETYQLALNDKISSGSMIFSVKDKEGRKLFTREIPYSQISVNEYSDIEINLQLERNKVYYFTVECRQLADGCMPKIGICGRDQKLRENKNFAIVDTLSGNETVQESQLLARFVYSDALRGVRVFQAILLGLVTAAIIWPGIPDNRRLKRILGLAAFILLPLILGRQLELVNVNPTFLRQEAVWFTLIILYVLELSVSFLCGNIVYGTAITGVIITVLYSANYYMYKYRGNPLRLNDLYAAKTAANVLGEYSLRPGCRLAFAWAVAVLFCVLALSCLSGYKKYKLCKGNKRHLYGRIIGIVIGVLVPMVMCFGLIKTDILERCGFEALYGVNQQMTYQFNGYIIASFLDIRNSIISPPEGYSVDRVESILKSNEVQNGMAENTEDLPHVILIMNESFSDLRVLGNLQISSENMGNFYSLDENTVRGNVNVSVIGGGTANSEFEVFTGCSMALLPDTYYPYQQCFFNNKKSLVSTMKNAGYTTYAMHPETKLNYNRGVVYDMLGFDNLLWKNDFNGAVKIHYGASDRDTYHKVEELFENRQSGEKMFIFDLTIQNHGGYLENDIIRTVEAVNAPCDEASNFLSLIKESDEAFAELIEYFENVDEKVIICMFGDHQPKIADENFYESIYGQSVNLSDEARVMNMYKTPFVIWANYDIEDREGLDISANYLGVELLKTAGVQMPPYFNYLEGLMEEYPIITANGCIDKEGVYHAVNEIDLTEYRLLQYRYLYDNDGDIFGY